MSIPLGMKYTSTVSGSIAKHVQCEQCSEEYVYIAERQASGEGSSALFLDNQGGKQRAADRAVKSLQKSLEKAVEPVPCIGCGWLQSDMVAEAKRRHHRWMLYVGCTLLAVGVLLGVLVGSVYGPGYQRDKPFSETWGYAGAIIGGVLVVVRMVLVSKYDPNTNEAAKEQFRKAIAGKVTSKEEFEQMICEASESEGNEDPSGDSDDASNAADALQNLRA